MEDKILQLYDMENPPKHKNIASGLYNGFEYYILWYVNHPNAYIKIPEGHPYFEKFYGEIDSNNTVNGGFTYSGENLNEAYGLKNGWYLGWDYAHYFDYVKSVTEDGRRWTVEDIINECRAVIDEVISKAKEGE